MTGVQTCALPIWMFTRYNKGIWFIKEADIDRDGLLSSGSTFPIAGERSQDLRVHHARRPTQAPIYRSRIKHLIYGGRGTPFQLCLLSSAGVVMLTQGQPGRLRRPVVAFLLSCPPTRRSGEEVGWLSLPREPGRSSPLLGGPPPSRAPRACGQRGRSAA